MSFRYLVLMEFNAAFVGDCSSSFEEPDMSHLPDPAPPILATGLLVSKSIAETRFPWERGCPVHRDDSRQLGDLRDARSSVFYRYPDSIDARALAHLFDEVAAFTRAQSTYALARPSDRPSAPLCAPLEAWGDVAVARIRTDPVCDMLSERAVGELRDYVICRIAAVHEMVLEYEFSAHREREILRRLSTGMAFNADSDDIIRDFVARLSDDLLGLYLRYPVLGRLSAEIFLQTIEFLLRAMKDVQEALPILTAAPVHAGTITGFRPGQGDPHSGQRTTIRVQIGRRRTFYYKPRNGRSQELWDQVARPYLTGRGEAPPPAVHGPDYSFVSATTRHVVSSLRETIWLAERAGRLLGLASLLRASDLHAENIIWGRSGPTVVDAEVIFCIARSFPELASDGVSGEGRASASGGGLLDSRLTALLPRKLWYGKRSYCVGGLSPTGAPSKRARVLGRNKNSRRRVRSSVVFDPGTCWPVDKSLASSAEASLLSRALLRGISKIECSLPEIREALMRQWRVGSKQIHIRFIFRDTSHYWRTVLELRRPEHLRCADRFAEALFSATSLFEAPPNTLDYFRSVGEAAALSRGEIPIFRYDFATGAGVDSDLAAEARIHSTPPIEVAQQDIDAAVEEFPSVPWPDIVASAVGVVVESVRQGKPKS